MVALLSLAVFVITRSNLARVDSGSIINTSGRQRMLSQRSALLAQRYVGAADPGERARTREQLEMAAQLMRLSHERLVNEPQSEAVADIYFGDRFGLDAQVRTYLNHLERLLLTPKADLRPDHPALLSVMAMAPEQLLEALDRAVGVYEAENTRQLERLRMLTVLLLIGMLIALGGIALFVFRPMELEITRRSDQLVHTAMHDSLTGLPNRLLFMDRLGQAMARRSRDHEQGFAVLFMDLDRFKIVNDSLGHGAGDQLLTAFSYRLRACVRAVDTVARLGGDEFTILLDGVRDQKEAEIVAKRINQSLTEPIQIGRHELRVSASIGVVLADPSHLTPEDVLRDADIAMYKSKARRDTGFEVFATEMRQEAQTVLALEHDLRRALAENAFELHYQPIVSAADQQVKGFEGLLRWTDPVLGRVSPGEFIPVAESSGLIAEIDRWVLREGARQLSLWHRKLDAELTLSLNVSSQQFNRPDFVNFASGLVDEFALDPGKLHLEITEGVLLSHTPELINTLERLKVLGFKLHIDDFGTGYSSLSYLQRFPADVLKIDRSFVDELTRDQASAELIQAIVVMAHALGMGVIAEGVETSEQVTGLQALACEYLQGYHFSKPLPAREVESLVGAALELA